MKYLKGDQEEEKKKEEVRESVLEEISVVPEIDSDKVTLDTYMKAAYSLIHIRTEEDNRAVDMVKEAIRAVPAMAGTVTFGEWRSTTGLVLTKAGTLEYDRKPKQVAKDILSALKYVEDQSASHVICYHNVRLFLATQQVVQQLKDSAHRAKFVGSHIFLVGPHLDFPPELLSSVTVYDLDLPNQVHFKELFRELAKNYEDTLSEKPSERVLNMTASSAVGMTELQGENAISLSIIMEKKLNPSIIQIEKEQAIKRSEVLEFIHSRETIDQVGGFKAFKLWLSLRKCALTPEAVEYGLRFPKGVLLVGVPGTGKSLCARAVSRYLELPLLKLDMGRVFQSLVGSSESNVRAAFKTAEAVAPVVLWIEEIEKSTAGSQSSGQSDSGTTARVMSTTLTWMQENTKPIFIVATANNVESLPPELLRKGRFSEIWGVVEPNDVEREEIWRIHIGKVRPKRVSEFDYPQLVEASSGYTGAEIETIVEDGMFNAFSDGAREPITDDFVLATRAMIPQSVTSEERVGVIRKWMKTKVRFVSSEGAEVTGEEKKVDGGWQAIRKETATKEVRKLQ